MICVHDKFVANLSRTLSQTPRHSKLVCVRDFRNLCPRLSPRGSFDEIRRNGMWALPDALGGGSLLNVDG